MSKNMNEALTPAKEFIRYALGIGALELLPEGRPLKSGRLSPYFFNAGLFRTGEAIAEISLAYACVIVEHFGDSLTPDFHLVRTFDLLYGPPYKGTILVPAVALQLSRITSSNPSFCTSRKETKVHGEGGLLIGAPIKQGDRVLIIDDVITDGGTKREAVEFIRSYGGKVVGLVIAFDRQERGTGMESSVQEFSREYGVPVYSIATLADLISALEENKKLSIALREKYKNISVKAGEQQDRDEMLEMLERLIAYRQEYGVS